MALNSQPSDVVAALNSLYETEMFPDEVLDYLKING